MNGPFLIAIIALGLSVLASAAKLVDWLLHSDPRALARSMRLLLIGLGLLSVPLLIFLLVRQQWTSAAGLVAVMLLIPALLGRGSLLRHLGLFPAALDNSPPAGPPLGEGGQASDAPDPDLVRRSAAILEAYLGRSPGAAGKGGLAPVVADWHGEGQGLAADGTSGFGSGPMSVGEALEILGLDQGAEDWQISEAHRRLLQKVRPDRGGSAYLAIKVTQARDVLLRAGTGQLRRLTTDLPRKSSR